MAITKDGGIVGDFFLFVNFFLMMVILCFQF